MIDFHKLFIYTRFESFVKKNKLLLIFLSIFILFHYSPEIFKFFFVTNCLVFLILLYLLKNFFLSLYSLFFINLFFLEPGKYYSFELLPAGYVKKEPFFSQGLLDGYGFLISDFLAIGMIFYFIREIFGEKKNEFLKIIRQQRIVLGSFAIFFLVLLFSSWFVSFFPTFSVMNTLQYGKLVVASLATVWICSSTEGKVKFVQLLVACLILNIFLSFSQVGFSLLHLTDPREKTVQIEDQLLFDRPTGLFLHSNELALFILFFWITLPKDVTLKNKIVSVGAWSVIFLSQSRTVWLAIVLSFLLIFFTQDRIKKQSYQIGKKMWAKMRKFPALFFIGIFTLFTIILPRAYSIRYTLLEGSGSIRLEMLKDGWTLLQFSPIYGFGANTNVLTAFFYLRDSYLRDFPYAIHNGYLQLALESGVLGAFFFFFPFIYLFFINLIQFIRTSSLSFPLNNIFILGCMFIYFLFQPHGGRFELPILGIILGYIVYTTDYEKGRF